ncbi:cytochrome-c oxidase, cbb3-type subunit I [Pseudoroseomonas rhizosphaerae]|uniref:cytochrome-c oxidase n=1 Tax=Teichococcus rhizosphaerae TaxID=1335062 RepID=A0A2C7AA42_9PROT|nr:cytochrome-c oxidase, cbb3-type subunit I [Pseudoroseomonas rhizosphaerae]PHK93497.1 cytochrome-c oxidase, cbb3-type subunit I [Pseudoroseomonas rhizosphaerae]
MSGTGTQVGAFQGAEAPPDYDDHVVRLFILASVFWALVGMAMGVFIAAQMVWPQLNAEPWFTFGRLRPVHTSGVVFAFGGNAVIGTSLYCVQRTCRARLPGRFAAEFVFWGYQFFIVLAALGYVMGVTQSREYAEPEWLTDLWLAVVWLTYLGIFVGTLLRRREPHIYVANWYYLAFVVAVTILHVVNNLAVPLAWNESNSVSLFGGVQDAMTQWWYGHNAVGFFLTAGFLGIMYYYLPKQADAPIWSYRLSIISFWSLVFMYMWAGPHHLHYTSLPDWVQTLGMTFTIMLWMPSWASALNGFMTASGRWDRLRTDPVLRFMIVAVVFYAVATFEGPFMGVRTVNGLSHYTEWTISHVHSGALGWNGFIVFGAIYYLVPRIWGRPGMHSRAAIEWHFWLGLAGIMLYVTAMWGAGVMQGLMWRAYTSLGFLRYSFLDTVIAAKPYYLMRFLGGLLYLGGAAVMAWNVWRTVSEPQPSTAEAAAPAAPAE